MVVVQQRVNGYRRTQAWVRHAMKRKTVFDKQYLNRQPGEVEFHVGQLVQIYRNDLHNTFHTERKLLPK